MGYPKKVTLAGPPIAMPRLPLESIRLLLAALTVTTWSPDGWPVIYQNDPLPFIGPMNGGNGAYLELNVSGFRSVGVDDYRQDTDTTTGNLVSAYYGVREFTLSIDCRSFAQDVPAWDILEALRLQMNNPRSVTVRAALIAMGISLIRCHSIVTLSPEKQDVDTRQIWRAVLDLEFNWLAKAQSVDDSGATIDTIGVVADDAPVGTNVVVGVVSNPDGNPWPTP